MPRTFKRTLLSDLAGKAGFTQSGLVAVCKAHTSTINRCWSDPRWLDKMQSETLQQLSAYIPGLLQMVEEHAVRTKRLEDPAKILAAEGIDIHWEAIDDAVSAGIPLQYIMTSLDAAAHILRGEPVAAMNYLRPLWGREQTAALDIVFGNNKQFQVLSESEPIVDAAVRMTEDLLSSKMVRFPRAVALAHLTHHTGKAGKQGIEQIFAPRTRASATQRNLTFAARGATMGVLRTSEDLDHVDAYADLVQRDHMASIIEEWAFPTWAGDVTNSEDFELDRNPKLINTAIELIREIEHYNEAYVYYLAKVYIPLAFTETDPQFGGKVFELAAALEKRAEKCTEKTVAEMCRTTAKLLKG